MLYLGGFTDDAGNAWSGHGPRTAWLREALEAVQNKNEFLMCNVMWPVPRWLKDSIAAGKSLAEFSRKPG